MTETSSQPLTDVHDMVVAHRAFRRDFRLLPPLVRAVAPGDTAAPPTSPGTAGCCSPACTCTTTARTCCRAEAARALPAVTEEVAAGFCT
jgi:hypothetical protein